MLVGAAVFTSGKGPEQKVNAAQALPLALGAIHPRIAPDGQTIAVSYQGAIWTVPSAGDTMTRLTDGDGFDHEPAWSPDGKTIAFVRGPNLLGGALHLIDAGTGKSIALPKPIQVRGTYNFHKLEFEPNGRRLRGGGHFYTDQRAEWTLPAGKYRIAVARGPEYRPAALEVDIHADVANTHAIVLSRWTHAARTGWYSGENHIHANYGFGHWYNSPHTMMLQCAGEDLNVGNFMVANSDTDGIFDRPFFRGGPDPRSTGETILYWNQEFRSTVWGHMTLVNLRQVVEPVMTGFKDTTNPWDIPTNADIAERTHWQKGHVNYTHAAQNAVKPLENPYAAKGLPIDVALGKIDSLDLNNSYAGTVPIWHRLLSCGFRLPPSAGTDCFLNRIFSQVPGGDRVYVHVDGPLSYAGWIDGLKKGRSFVSNGPMLELSVDGQELGSEVKLAGPAKLMVKAKAHAAFPPFSKVGTALQRRRCSAKLPLGKDDRSASLEQALAVEKSGWLALRALGPGDPNGLIGGHFRNIGADLRRSHRRRPDPLAGRQPVLPEVDRRA